MCKNSGLPIQIVPFVSNCSQSQKSTHVSGRCPWKPHASWHCKGCWCEGEWGGIEGGAGVERLNWDSRLAAAARCADPGAFHTCCDMPQEKPEQLAKKRSGLINRLIDRVSGGLDGVRAPAQDHKAVVKSQTSQDSENLPG